MSGNDWNDIGNRIKNIVQDAVESQNYQELNRQVKGILNDAVGGFREGIKGDGAQNGTGENVREDGRYGREDSGRTENQDSLRESMKSVGAGLRDGLKSVGEDWKSAWKESKETDGDGAPSYRDRYRKVKEPGYRPGQNSAAGGPRTICPLGFSSSSPGLPMVSISPLCTTPSMSVTKQYAPVSYRYSKSSSVGVPFITFITCPIAVLTARSVSLSSSDGPRQHSSRAIRLLSYIRLSVCQRRLFRVLYRLARALLGLCRACPRYMLRLRLCRL